MIEITEGPIDAQAWTERVRSPRAGAVCTFLGTVREMTGDRRTAALDYEAYPEMALKALAKLEEEARRRWPIVEAALVHRVGHLDLGEISVVVGHTRDEGRGWTRIEVSDQGLGIPRSDLPHIWEPFRRGRNIPANLRGMGLGLASVQQIVKQHGGKITVASVEGRGSTFTVHFPEQGGCG